MFNRVVATCLQNVVKADKVGFDIYVRVGDTITHAGLCGKVDDDIRLVFGKNPLDQCFVGKVSFDEGSAALMLCLCQFFNFGKAIFFE